MLRDREVGEETRVTVTLAGDRKEKVVQNVAGSAAVNLVLAIFPSLEAGGDSSPWSAKIGVGLSRIRKLMAEGTAPHADREVATTLPTAGAQWSQRWLTVDYRFAFADADRTRPDPSAIQSLAASFHPTTRFTLRAGGSEGGSGPHDRQSRYASVGFDWQLGRAFSLSGGCAADVRSAARAGAAGDCGLDGQVAKSLDFFGPLRTPIELYAAPSFGARRYPAGATDLAQNDWHIGAQLGFRF